MYKLLEIMVLKLLVMSFRRLHVVPEGLQLQMERIREVMQRLSEKEGSLRRVRSKMQKISFEDRTNEWQRNKSSTIVP